MPLIRELRDEKDGFTKALKKRFASSDDFLRGLKTYENFRALKKECDDIRAERNIKSKEFARTKDKIIVAQVKKLKSELARKEEALRKVEEELRTVELTLPNWVDDDVPVGRGEEENVPIRFIGEPGVIEGNEAEFRKRFPDVKFHTVPEVPHHSDIVDLFGLVDMKSGAKLAGARFYVETGALATLDLAMSLFAMKEFAARGFRPVIPPFMMKRGVEEKITYFTAFEDAIYSLKEDDLVLITTSEHPLAGIYDGRIFEQGELPLRLVAFSPAFRREAGSHGKDTKGIFRTHQFSKVELHSIVEPGKDREELDFLVRTVEEVMAKLDFPYRIVANSSGDMDSRARVQYDLEAWFPAQNTYRELHSFATVGQWISEKIGTKVRVGGDKKPVENLYATGVAVQRTLLAILVNNYDPATGTIRIPAPLAEMSGISELKPVR